MIKFTFDVNALSHLMIRPDYNAVKQRLSESIERQVNVVLVSEATIAEIVKGTSSKNFLSMQNWMREAYIISGKGHVLPHPRIHVRRAAGVASNSEYCQGARRLLAISNTFLELSNYNDFLSKFGAYQEELRRESGEHYEYMLASTEGLKERKGRVRSLSLQERFSRGRNVHYFRLFYEVLLRRYGLVDACKGWTHIRVMRELPSLYVFCMVYLARVYERVFDRLRVIESDEFDLENIAYLDMCDYLITDDGDIIRFFKSIDCPFCYRRAITVDTFVSHIQKPFLLSRLTHPRYSNDTFREIVV